jgi:hypothetical protein
LIGTTLSHYRIVEKIGADRARQNSRLVETASLVQPSARGALVEHLNSTDANFRQRSTTLRGDPDCP